MNPAWAGRRIRLRWRWRGVASARTFTLAFLHSKMCLSLANLTSVVHHIRGRDDGKDFERQLLDKSVKEVLNVEQSSDGIVR